MIFFAALVFGALAFGSQVVLSLNFKFELSQVQQCEPVSITFVGDANANAVPMSLTLLPFGSHPISIPIPNAAATTSGIYVTFFPFPEGTTFIAALEDGFGENIAKVSDVIRVLPSPTGNTTCLPNVKGVEEVLPNIYTLDNTLSQCEDFTVSYNRTVVSTPPIIRLYSPKGPSFLLNQTSLDEEKGFATYLMSRERAKQVVLLLSDGQSHQETSALMSIAGDSQSSEACLPIKGEKPSQKSSGVSQAVIIGSAAGGGVIVLISILMVLFILRERRRRRSDNIGFDPALLEKGRSPTPENHRRSPSPIDEKKVSYGSGFVKDPPYTAEKFLSPTTSFYPRTSMASWAQATPEDQRFPATQSLASTTLENLKHDDRLSLTSLDIEGILNLAAGQSTRSSRQTLEPIPFAPLVDSPTYDPSSGTHLAAAPRRYPARGHLREPSDVPVGPNSMAFSAISENPFIDRSEIRDSVVHSQRTQASLDSVLKPPPGALIGLPSSPRNGFRSSRERISGGEGSGIKSSNRSTKDSMGDWYGIAR